MAAMADARIKPSAKRTLRLGVVDYTLAKRALIRDARRGLLSRTDLCDAHPELMRAARNVGEDSRRPCPVCDEPGMRLVAYVYADDLRANNGRVWSIRQALSKAAASRNGACYVVEVCTDCGWNHLHEAFVGRGVG
jgi:hypothetical protein